MASCWCGQGERSEMKKVLEEMRFRRVGSSFRTSKLKQDWEICAQKRCGEKDWELWDLVGGVWSRRGPVPGLAVIAMDYLPLSP